MKLLKINLITLSVFAMFNLLYGCRSIPKGVSAVKPFDADKYLGTWYEIARFDYRFERNLSHVTATYSIRKDGKINVDNRGYDTKNSVWKQNTGKAKPASDLTEARLKVFFFGPFYSGYNVIAIDAGYQYALVAGKNTDYLWLLSRNTTMPGFVKQEYLALAKSIGYDTTRLIWVSHTPPIPIGK